MLFDRVSRFIKSRALPRIIRHKRKREISAIAAAFMYTILFLSALAISCVMCAQNEILYEKVQIKVGVFGGDDSLSLSEARVINKSLSDFLSGKTDEICTASERAHAHMRDVKDIFAQAGRLSAIGFGAFAAFSFLSRRTPVKRLLAAALFIPPAFFALLALFSKADFGLLFYRFHRLLFSNDLWILDPLEDRMIRYLTQDFFLLMAVEAIKRGGIIYVFLCLIQLAFINTFGRRDN